jgi:hypothetical protein
MFVTLPVTLPQSAAAYQSAWSPGMLARDGLMELAAHVGGDQLAVRQAQQQFDDPINIQYTSDSPIRSAWSLPSHGGRAMHARLQRNAGLLEQFTIQ